MTLKTVHDPPPLYTSFLPLLYPSFSPSDILDFVVVSSECTNVPSYL